MPSAIEMCLLMAILTHRAISQIDLENRIMQGFKADIRDFPWMVALFKQPNYYTISTGTVIASRWVLTTAHTFKNRLVFSDPSNWYNFSTLCLMVHREKDNQRSVFVKFGASNIRESEGEWGRISDIYSHPNYVPDKIGNYRAYDVALLNMTEEFPFREGYVMPKQLFPTDEILDPGTVCVTAGFGNTGTKEDDKPHSLYFLPMPIMKSGICDKLFRGFEETDVCIGLPKLDAALCSGDSGVSLGISVSVMVVTSLF
jgi:Trypsin